MPLRRPIVPMAMAGSREDISIGAAVAAIIAGTFATGDTPSPVAVAAPETATKITFSRKIALLT